VTIFSLLDRLFTGTGLLDPVGADPELYVLYFLGLAAVGLLCIRRNWRHRAIAGILTAFWLRIALGAWLAPAGGKGAFISGGVEVLAVVEALLLFVEGVIRGSLRFEGRRGPWPVLGGALLVYALAVHPLLGAVLPGGLFGAFFFGMPIPPLVFTLGMLFFLRSPFPRHVFAIPLLWAAAGGSAPLLGTAHLWVLRVLFFVGCGFVFIPENLWKSRWRIDGRAFYEFGLRSRRALSAYLWGMFVGSLGYLFLSENGKSFEDWFVRLSTSTGLLGTCAVALWLAFPAWLNPWFRSLAWMVARGTRALWATFKSALWLIVTLEVVVIVVDYVGYKVNDNTHPILREPFTPARQVQFVAGIFLLWLIYLAYLGRKRLVIQPFTDYTARDEAGGRDRNGGKEKKSGIAEQENLVGTRGVDSDLRSALSRISDLYHVIDEALPRLGPSIEVTAEVRDVGEILKEAAGSGSSFKFLGVEIPTNFILSLVARLVRGPRLTGSVHGTGKEVFLIAEISGGGMRGNWRVDCTHLEKEDRGLSGEPAIRKLTEQLAYRIATNLVSVGSPRWQAVRCFTEGLRYYRETQRTKKDRGINLRLAEKCLINAGNDDDQFAQSHYNLGVVYRHLGELGSAKAAFRSAMRVAPGYYEACYALAETGVEEKNYEEALWVCDSAIGIDSSDDRAWDLKAYALRQYKQVQRKRDFSLLASDEAWDEISNFRQIAAALSWRRLCRAELSGRPFEMKERRNSALICTSNLAVVLGRMESHLPESERIFRQAVQLVEHDPETHVSFGKALYRSNRWIEAARTLMEVFDDGLDLSDRTALWSILTRVRARETALTYREPPDERYASAMAYRRQVFQRLLDVMFSLQEGESLKKVIDVLKDIKSYTELGAYQVEEQLWLHRGRGAFEGVSSGVLTGFRQCYQELAAEGHGLDGDGMGRINCAIRLCRFLRVLEGDEDEKDLKSLQWLQKSLQSEAQVRVDIEWIKGIQTTLSRLYKAPHETVEVYLDRLWKEAGNAFAFPPQMASKAHHDFHCHILQALGLMAEEGGAGPVIRNFVALQKASIGLAPAAPYSALRNRARSLLSECIDDAQFYWEWANCQVGLKEARLCLDMKVTGSRRHELVTRAVDLFESAIHKLEARESSQPRTQGLYGLLAQAHVVLSATLASVNPKDGKEFKGARELANALAYSERATELNPESARERLTLVQVYSVLGDYHQAKEEADIALSFDNGSEALQTVGSSFWKRAVSAETRMARRAVLREAVTFFSDALQLIESAAFDTDHPREQMESHAWAHHWLGRFHCELMQHEIGIRHEEVAKAMGFKPIESRVNLALGYLESRSHEKAEAAFLEARDAVTRLAPSLSLREVLDAHGEERPLGELLIDLCLGWALLQTERALGSESSLRLIRRTEQLASEIIAGIEPSKRSPLKAALHECLAWIHLRAGQGSESLHEATLSLRFGFRSGAYLCRARACLMAEKPSPAETRKAREACQSAQEIDLRGRYCREIRDVLRQIRRLEGGVPKPPAAPPPAAQPRPAG
jgi:tetratricopeptide (TPR) repeat protein